MQVEQKEIKHFGNIKNKKKLQIEQTTDDKIEEEAIEGKKYIMKSLKMENEFESFYSHGEASLVGERYFGSQANFPY